MTGRPNPGRGNCDLTIETSLEQTRDELTVLSWQIVQPDKYQGHVAGLLRGRDTRRGRHDQRGDRYSHERVVCGVAPEAQRTDERVRVPRPRHASLRAVCQL